MNRVREEEPDYFHIYLERENGEIARNILLARWFKFELEISAEGSLITQEEFADFIEWTKKTRPISGYKISKVFDRPPTSVNFANMYGNDIRTMLDYKLDIEEVVKT